VAKEVTGRGEPWGNKTAISYPQGSLALLRIIGVPERM